MVACAEIGHISFKRDVFRFGKMEDRCIVTKPCEQPVVEFSRRYRVICADLRASHADSATFDRLGFWSVILMLVVSSPSTAEHCIALFSLAVLIATSSIGLVGRFI